jgi:hypothetical protein
MSDIILRILAWTTRAEGFVEAYSDVLIISNIMCYVRLMNVFAVSKSLVPCSASLSSFPLIIFLMLALGSIIFRNCKAVQRRLAVVVHLPCFRS